MKLFILKIVNFNRISTQNRNFECEEDSDLWVFMKDNLLYDDEYRNIPIPVFSYVKPTMGPKFILHIMLSLGEFETQCTSQDPVPVQVARPACTTNGESVKASRLKRHTRHLLQEV